MKKTLFSALAAGALLAGGAVQAQDLPSQILGAILNNNHNAYPYGYQAAPNAYVPPVRMLQDNLGRYFYYDAQGNVVYLNNGIPNVTAHNNTPQAYGMVLPYGVENDRRYGYQNDRRLRDRDRDRDGVPNRYDEDRDGDGVRNRNDRYPNDRRYR